MTSALSWQNSISFCLASISTPRPNSSRGLQHGGGPLAPRTLTGLLGPVGPPLEGSHPPLPTPKATAGQEDALPLPLGILTALACNPLCPASRLQGPRELLSPGTPRATEARGRHPCEELEWPREGTPRPRLGTPQGDVQRRGSSGLVLESL